MYDTRECLPEGFFKIKINQTKISENAEQSPIDLVLLYFFVCFVVPPVLYLCYKRIGHTRRSNFTGIKLSRTISKSTVVEKL